MCFKLKIHPILKEFRKWIGRCWTSQINANTESEHTQSEHTGSEYTGSQYTGSQYTGSQYTGSQYTGSQYTGSEYTGSEYTGSEYTGSTRCTTPEEPLTEALEVSPSNFDVYVPSEFESRNNKGSWSHLQENSSRTQTESAEMARISQISQISQMPCCVAHPLLFRYHLAQNQNTERSEHVRHRGLSGSTHGVAGNQKPQSRGTLSSSGMPHHSHNTNMEEIINSELHPTAENLDSFRSSSTSLSDLTDKDLSGLSEGADEGNDPSEPQIETFRYVVPSPTRDIHFTSASMEPSCRPSCSSDKLPSCILVSRAPVNSYKSSLIPPLYQTAPDACRVKKGPLASQDKFSGSSPRSSVFQISPTLVETDKDTDKTTTTTRDTLQSSTESLAPSALDRSDSSVISQDSYQGEGASGYSSQTLKECNSDFVCRPKERLPVEETQCRFCHFNEILPDDPLLSPCNCTGSMKFVHFSCLKKWLQIRIESGLFLLDVQTCEVCGEKLFLDPDMFDWVDFFMKHRPNVEEELAGNGNAMRRQILTALRQLEIEILLMHYQQTST